MSARPVALAMALSVLALAGACQRSEGRRVGTVGERVAVLAFETQVRAEPELENVPVALPPARRNAAWTESGGSPSKAMGHLELPATPQRAWTASVGRGSDPTRRLNAAPVVAGGRVFTIDTEGEVRAHDAQSGRLLWQQRVLAEGESARAAFGGGVALGAESVYVTTGHGVAAALDPANGAERWRWRAPTPLRGAPVVEAGQLLVTTQDGQLFALDANTGEMGWQATATLEPAAILGPGTPAAAENTGVAGFPSGELVALRLENGRTVWQDQLARTARTTALGALSDIVASPVIDAGRVFAIGHGGRIVALELATGTRVWERPLAGISTPALAGDWLFAVTVDAQLVAMARADGRIRWVSQLPRWRNERRETGAIVWAGPVAAGGRLWLVSSERQMVAVNPADGEIMARLPLGAPAFLPPVVSDGALYLVTDDGRLQAWR